MAKEADYFLNLWTPLAYWDHGLSSWKTYQLSLLGEAPPCLEKLPAVGMTRSGKLYPRKAWERRTLESAGSVWPTPTLDSQFNRKEKYAQGGTPLIVAIKWATPTVNGNHNTRKHCKKNQRSGDGLTTQVKKNWPTPLARDYKGHNSIQGTRRKDGKSRMDGLPNAAKWTGTELEGSLNPDWVESLMGYPAGWTTLGQEEEE